jgi:hypothetical protein
LSKIRKSSPVGCCHPQTIKPYAIDGKRLLESIGLGKSEPSVRILF